MSISLKRKREDEDEFVEGIIDLRKRAKLEEIIFRAVSEEEKNQGHFSVSEHSLFVYCAKWGSLKM